MAPALSYDALIRLRNSLRADAKRLYERQEELRIVADGILNESAGLTKTADLIDALIAEERELAKAREHCGPRVRLVKEKAA
jgi:hypothetical protein